MLTTVATFILLVTTHASAQNSSSNTSELCFDAFNSAVATGNASFQFFDPSETNPTIFYFNESGHDSAGDLFNWVYTVSEDGSNSFFLGSPPGVNFSNVTNDYSACVIALPLSLNTIG